MNLSLEICGSKGCKKEEGFKEKLFFNIVTSMIPKDIFN